MTGNRTNSDKLDDLTNILIQFQETMNLKLDAVTNRVESLEQRSPGTDPRTSTPPPPPTNFCFWMS
jgi:uncharacterized coiled-coil protein SlyX